MSFEVSLEVALRIGGCLGGEVVSARATGAAILPAL